MPILHFSGKFKFQLPFFNNRPDNDARDNDAYDKQFKNKDLKVKFDDKSAELSKDEIHQRLVCDPSKYFEFEFSDVVIRRITYNDGSIIKSKEKDPLIGKFILMKGLLVDLAPHLQRGRLFAGEIRVTDTLVGKIKTPIQSKVHQSILIQEKTKDNLFHYSGYFESNLYEVFQLNDPNITNKTSQYISELRENLNLKVYFHLIRYDINKNEGEVFGYLGASLPLMNKHNTLIKNRPLFFNKSLFSLDNHLIDDLGIKSNREVTFPKATFEIQEENNLFILRYIDIIPFIDYEYSTPENYQFYLSIDDKNKDEQTSIKYEILDFSYKELTNSGGIIVLKLPSGIDMEKLTVKIKIKEREKLVDLLQEPDWNIVLDESKDNYECISMYSNEIKKLTGILFYKGNLYLEKKIINFSPSDSNHSADKEDDSPHVTWFEESKTESNKGFFEMNIISRNLENSPRIYDPVTSDNNHQNYLEGDLPWDRYYGNQLNIEMKDTQAQYSTELAIMVRVIHKIKDEDITNFKDITKLFSYYMRYYPWLHVRIEDCYYNQFLDFNDLDKIRQFKDKILTRLGLEDNDWFKMPRSRDFPKNGDKVIKLLKSDTE